MSAQSVSRCGERLGGRGSCRAGVVIKSARPEPRPPEADISGQTIRLAVQVLRLRLALHVFHNLLAAGQALCLADHPLELFRARIIAERLRDTVDDLEELIRCNPGGERATGE